MLKAPIAQTDARQQVALPACCPAARAACWRDLGATASEHSRSKRSRFAMGVRRGRDKGCGADGRVGQSLRDSWVVGRINLGIPINGIRMLL
jgi:hypothetical protein